MKKLKNFIDTWGEKLFSNTYQLQRIIILLAILLVVAVVSFAGYYYYDRYYQPQPRIAQQTIAQAEQALREDPQNTGKRLNLAEIYMLNRRYDDAIARAVEVMTVEPDNQRAWLVLGVANALKGNPADAIDPLEKFLEANKDAEMPGLNKSLQSAAYYLGDSYLKLNQPDKAVTALEKAVDWSQTDADAMYKLGLAYASVNRFEEAVNMFHKATVFVPNYTEAYAGMGNVFDATNQPDLANYARGMVAFSTKDYNRALDLLQKSASAKSDFAPTFDGLGMTYEAMNDLPNAKAAFEKALVLDPNDFTASNGVQRVTALLNK